MRARQRFKKLKFVEVAKDRDDAYTRMKDEIEAQALLPEPEEPQLLVVDDDVEEPPAKEAKLSSRLNFLMGEKVAEADDTPDEGEFNKFMRMLELSNN